jgi:hypothetical protein
MTNNDLTVEEETPTFINVTKVVTYDCRQIASDLEAQGMKDPTFDDVLGMIEEFAKEDFSCGFGHEANTRELIFTNADTGDEL